MTIKAIIIDLGGVIIDIDYQLTAKAFEKLGAINFNQVYSQAKQTALFDAYETGKMDSLRFREELKKLLDLVVNDELFDEAWNAMLLQLPLKRLEYIQQLKQEGYQTFLFSNINPIHLKKVFEICLETAKRSDFEGCFVKEYYSHTFGFRKPNQESFLKILQEQGLSADETLFVDDSPQHIAGAKSAGLHTLLIDKAHSLFSIGTVIEALNKESCQEMKEVEGNFSSTLSI